MILHVTTTAMIVRRIMADLGGSPAMSGSTLPIMDDKEFFGLNPQVHASPVGVLLRNERSFDIDTKVGNRSKENERKAVIFRSSCNQSSHPDMISRQSASTTVTRTAISPAWGWWNSSSEIVKCCWISWIRAWHSSNVRGISAVPVAVLVVGIVVAKAGAVAVTVIVASWTVEAVVVMVAVGVMGAVVSGVSADGLLSGGKRGERAESQ